MQRVSSNASLFLKLFLPTFWLVFFGLFTLMSILTENDNPYFNTTSYKISIAVLYLAVAFVFYISFLKLKRVEMGPGGFTVSNYFKTYKYNYANIENFRENNYYLFRTVKISFKEKSMFGKKISFISNKSRIAEFFKSNPEIYSFLKDKIS